MVLIVKRGIGGLFPPFLFLARLLRLAVASTIVSSDLSGFGANHLQLVRLSLVWPHNSSTWMCIGGKRKPDHGEQRICSGCWMLIDDDDR